MKDELKQRRGHMKQAKQLDALLVRATEEAGNPQHRFTETLQMVIGFGDDYAITTSFAPNAEAAGRRWTVEELDLAIGLLESVRKTLIEGKPGYKLSKFSLTPTGPNPVPWTGPQGPK